MTKIGGYWMPAFAGMTKRKRKGNLPTSAICGGGAAVGRASLEKLAAADAFRSLGLDRRQALWEVRGLPKELPLPLFDHADAARDRRRGLRSRFPSCRSPSMW